MCVSSASRHLLAVAASLLLSAVFVGEAPALRRLPPDPAAALAGQLRATRALLRRADHDYEGHRVKAIHEITRAIHALEPAAGRRRHPRVGGLRPAPGGKEPQAVSDAQLRKALEQLQATRANLGAAPPRNVAVAGAAIDRAVRELQIALKIR
jgi:hypothetical protein